MIKTGLCACKYCKPMKFRAKGIWILREINHEYQTDTIYAVCREYYSEKLKSMFIGEYHEQKVNTNCTKKNYFNKCLGRLLQFLSYRFARFCIFLRKL